MLAEKCLEIAEIISNKDVDVMAELRESFASPSTYIDKHRDRFSEYFMLDENELNDFAADKWRVMVEILELHEYVCTRDWKDELEDFLWAICRSGVH